MKIQSKLFLILFSFSFLLVATLVLLTQWSLGKGMVEYVNAKEIESLNPVVVELNQLYKVDNNWEEISGKHGDFHRLIVRKVLGENFFPQRRKGRPPHDRPRRHGKSSDSNKANSGIKPNYDRPPPGDHFPPNPPFGINGQTHFALLDINKDLVVGNYPKGFEYNQIDIVVENKVVGYLVASKRKRLSAGYEVDFIEQQQVYLWIIALIIMSFVFLITLPLTHHLVEPLKLITRGMHQLTQGDYQHNIDLKRKDELGNLSRDYNELAITLAENETARKRWLANISHELRTPVAILRGELEAMLDDIRPITKSNITSASDEVRHLQRLIEDLHQLTSADIGGMRYQKERQPLTVLLTGEFDKYESYLADAGIKLSFESVNNDLVVYGDKTRLCQLFENIINNAIKYAKSTKLNIGLSHEEINGQRFAKIVFEDNGIGVEDSHLENLFDYLYRVDHSRNRKDGGAGLGLSICRQIVMAHKGEISAKHSTLGGLAIIIKLPMD